MSKLPIVPEYKVVDAFQNVSVPPWASSQLESFNWTGRLTKIRSEAMPVVWTKESMEATYADSPSLSIPAGVNRQPTRYFGRTGTLIRHKCVDVTSLWAFDIGSLVPSSVIEFLDDNNIFLTGGPYIGFDPVIQAFAPWTSVAMVTDPASGGGSLSHPRPITDAESFTGGDVLVVHVMNESSGAYSDYNGADPRVNWPNRVSQDAAIMAQVVNRFARIKVIVHDIEHGDGFHFNDILAGFPSQVVVRPTGAADLITDYLLDGRFLADLEDFFG